MTTPPKLLDKVREVLRRRHDSHQTEKSYIQWMKRFIAFHGMKPPREICSPEVEAFLTHLAISKMPVAVANGFGNMFFLRILVLSYLSP
jgi:hypothetical protein